MSDNRRRRRQAVMSMLLGADQVSYEGVGLVNFDANGEALEKLIASFDPIQNFNGYDHPWPPGGWVNKLIECVPGTYASTNCQGVVSADGTITVSGTTGGSSETIIIPLKAKITTPSEQFYIHLFNTANGDIAPSFELSTNVGGTNIAPACAPANRIYTTPANRLGVEIDRVRFWIGANKNASVTIHPMFALTSAVVPWVTYANICPISGWTGLYVYHSGADTSDYDTYSAVWSDHGTVYGGYVDIITGALYKTHKYVDASDYTWHNAGTNDVYHTFSDKMAGLNTAISDTFVTTTYADNSRVAWIDDNISRADKLSLLASGDIHICYQLRTASLVATLTPQQIDTLVGENNIWSNTGGKIVVSYTPS